MTISFWTEARESFHAALFESVLVTDKSNVPSNADKDSRMSVEIARGILSSLGSEAKGFALPELVDTVKELGYEDAKGMLDTLISGKRLRDISDLPLDLVV